MIATNLPAGISLIAGLLIASFVTGFLFRRTQVRALQRKVTELEKEMLANHADILELQRDKTLLENKLRQPSIPVISIATSKDEKNQDTGSEGYRKKVGQAAAIKKHSSQ